MRIWDMDEEFREYPISNQDWLVEVVHTRLVMLLYRVQGTFVCGELPSTSLNHGGSLFLRDGERLYVSQTMRWIDIRGA